jgi:hypothetical protein
MEYFTIKCNACGGAAQHHMDGKFDTAANAFVAKFTLICQRCNRQESVIASAPKQDLLPSEADAEVKAAIAEVLG